MLSIIKSALRTLVAGIKETALVMLDGIKSLFGFGEEAAETVVDDVVTKSVALLAFGAAFVLYLIPFPQTHSLVEALFGLGMRLWNQSAQQARP